MIYSLDKVNEMAEGDQDFVLSVVSVFLEEVPTDLADLESAIAELQSTSSFLTAQISGLTNLRQQN